MIKPKIYNMEQGSLEWVKIRLGIPTASRFSDILAKGRGITRHKYMLGLIYEIRNKMPMPSYTNNSMLHGIEAEPLAREYYEGYKKVKVEQVGFVECYGVGCSPDGLIGEDGGVEIKNPDIITHYDYYLKKKMPTAYYAQVQGSLLVTGRQWWDFVSFDNRNTDTPFFCIRVERDEKYIANLRKEIDVFLYDMNEIMDKLDCPI